ncbi:unnamed protein product, partial [Amoebophrya sp. A25]
RGQHPIENESINHEYLMTSEAAAATSSGIGAIPIGKHNLGAPPAGPRVFPMLATNVDPAQPQGRPVSGHPMQNSLSRTDFGVPQSIAENDRKAMSESAAPPSAPNPPEPNFFPNAKVRPGLYEPSQAPLLGQAVEHDFNVVFATQGPATVAARFAETPCTYQLKANHTHSSSHADGRLERGTEDARGISANSNSDNLMATSQSPVDSSGIVRGAKQLQPGVAEMTGDNDGGKNFNEKNSKSVNFGAASSSALLPRKRMFVETDNSHNPFGLGTSGGFVPNNDKNHSATKRGKVARNEHQRDLHEGAVGKNGNSVNSFHLSSGRGSSPSSPPDVHEVLVLAQGLKKLGRRSLNKEDFEALGTSKTRLEDVLRKLNRTDALARVMESSSFQAWREQNSQGDSPRDLLRTLGDVHVLDTSFSLSQQARPDSVGGSGPSQHQELCYGGGSGQQRVVGDGSPLLSNLYHEASSFVDGRCERCRQEAEHRQRLRTAPMKKAHQYDKKPNSPAAAAAATAPFVMQPAQPQVVEEYDPSFLDSVLGGVDALPSVLAMAVLEPAATTQIGRSNGLPVEVSRTASLAGSRNLHIPGGGRGLQPESPHVLPLPPAAGIPRPASSSSALTADPLKVVCCFPGQWWVSSFDEMRPWFLKAAHNSTRRAIICEDAKAFVCMLRARNLFSPHLEFAEPRIAAWMLDPDHVLELGELREKFAVPSLSIAPLVRSSVKHQAAAATDQRHHTAGIEHQGQEASIKMATSRQTLQKNGQEKKQTTDQAMIEAAQLDLRRYKYQIGDLLTAQEHTGFDTEAAEASLFALNGLLNTGTKSPKTEQHQLTRTAHHGDPNYVQVQARPDPRKHCGSLHNHSDAAFLPGSSTTKLTSLQTTRVGRPLLQAVQEAYSCLHLVGTLYSRLVDAQMEGAFMELQMPFQVLLADIEVAGLPFNRDWETHTRIVHKSAALQERSKDLVGRRVNLASSEDCGRALFEDLQIRPPKGLRFRRKPNGRTRYTSGKDVLQGILREAEVVEKEKIMEKKTDQAKQQNETHTHTGNRKTVEQAASDLQSPRGARAISPTTSRKAGGEGLDAVLLKNADHGTKGHDVSLTSSSSEDEDDSQRKVKDARADMHDEEAELLEEADGGDLIAEEGDDEEQEAYDEFAGGRDDFDYNESQQTAFLPNKFTKVNPGFELIDHISEYRHLQHVINKFMKLQRCAVEVSPPEDYNHNEHGVNLNSAANGDEKVSSLENETDGVVEQFYRVRTSFSFTATGRIVVRNGRPQLLCVDNPFEILDVVKLSFHKEGIKKILRPISVIVGVAAALPPLCRYRLGYACTVLNDDDDEDDNSERVDEVEKTSISMGKMIAGKTEQGITPDLLNAGDAFDNSKRAVCRYWAKKGWEIYKNPDYVKKLRRVVVQLGNYRGNTLDEYSPDSPDEKDACFFDSLKRRQERDARREAKRRKRHLQPGSCRNPDTGIVRREKNREREQHAYLSYPSDQVWRTVAPVYAATDGKSTQRRISVNLRQCFQFPKSSGKLFLSVDY